MHSAAFSRHFTILPGGIPTVVKNIIESTVVHFRLLEVGTEVRHVKLKYLLVKLLVRQPPALPDLFLRPLVMTIIVPMASGVGTGGSGGSMNRDPRAPGAPEYLGPPSSGATEKF